MEDSIPIAIAVIDTVHRVIADSVTLEALNKSQEFYSSAFSCFVAVVSILALFLIAFTVIAVAFNFKSAEKAKNEIKNEIKELEKKLEKFKEQSENERKGLMNFIEDSRERQKEENMNLPFKIDTELQEAINAAFSDEQEKQNFINDYTYEIKRFREYDPNTLAILEKFQREKGATEFIKYLKGFFESLCYWSEEKINCWTLLSKKEKETEFLECMKLVDSSKLKEIMIKIARFQSIRSEYVFFREREDFINY